MNYFQIDWTHSSSFIITWQALPPKQAILCSSRLHGLILTNKCLCDMFQLCVLWLVVLMNCWKFLICTSSDMVKRSPSYKITLQKVATYTNYRTRSVTNLLHPSSQVPLQNQVVGRSLFGVGPPSCNRKVDNTAVSQGFEPETSPVLAEMFYRLSYPITNQPGPSPTESNHIEYFSEKNL